MTRPMDRRTFIATTVRTGAALTLASGLSIDSRVKTDILKKQYAAMGGEQYGLNLLRRQRGAGTYSFTLNGEEVTITLTELPPPAAPPPPADNSRRLKAVKTVSPTTAVTGSLTTFTYTITVTNRDDNLENLTKIHDELPTGFTYVLGSTSGVTTANPSISGHQLTWNLGGGGDSA